MGLRCAAWIQHAPGAQETSDEDDSTVQQAHVTDSVLHRGLILLRSTTIPETYDFKYLPQMKITVNVYSSG